MKRILLYKNGNRILGSTGLMHIDGRFGLEKTKNIVRDRNTRCKNFPHEICDAFIFCDDRLKETGKLIQI